MNALSNIAVNPAERASASLPIGALAGRTILRLIRAGQPISRVQIAARLGVNRSTVTEAVKPLIAAGVLREEQTEFEAGVRKQGRPRVGLMFNNDDEYFAGVYLGVRGIQIGLTTLSGKNLGEDSFETPPDADDALEQLKTCLDDLCAGAPDRQLRGIGVSVPGVTDADRSTLIYAPHLDWHNIAIADALRTTNVVRASEGSVKIVVENDATASAIYESRLRLKKTTGGVLEDFILVRSGTGIGVGLVIGGEVYRGAGTSKGIAGEFGHMTIVADGKPCVCGNRGCWEKYASASAAPSLYTGDRMQLGSTSIRQRFTDIVARAEAGETRAQATLERVGQYLGIGIGNVITGFGVPRVILSGRIVLGWKFFHEPLKKAVGMSMAGKLSEWSVEPGEPRGAGLGGAFEVIVEEYLSNGFQHLAVT